MPLIKSALQFGIENTLKTEFRKDSVKYSLRKYLDGGSSVGAKTSAKSIDTALGNINLLAKAVNAGKADNLPSQVAAGTLIKKITANEWANAISDSVSEWMSSEIAPIIAKVIADEVDKYIKSATIITPAGQITAGTSPAGPTTGATTTPSSPALIS